MTCFEFTVDIAAEPSQVQDAFWQLERWPSMARHVRAMNIHYDDGVVQVVTMDVVTGRERTSFKSVRTRSKNSISYVHPEPPAALNLHHGSWSFAVAPAGTRVTCRHEIEVNLDRALKFLASAGIAVPEGCVEEVMQQVIQSNSLQTMNALKGSLERQRSSGHEAFDHQIT